MLTLTFETSNFGASAALFEDATLVCHQRWEGTHGQGAYLVKALKDMMATHNKRLLEVDEVITTVGPGSFTGQRIGLAVAKTLNFAGGLQVLGVSSFAWIAKGFRDAHPTHQAPFMVCLDTGRQDRFCQLYNADGTPKGEARALTQQDMDTLLPEDAILVGQPWKNDPRILQTPWTPHARDLMNISQENILPLEPLYLRDAHTTPHP